MAPLRPGQDVVLSWSVGAADCRVVAAAGAYVLLRPQRSGRVIEGIPATDATLTFLDGMIPMGWDGALDFGAEAGELRFRINDAVNGADRRSSVRLPIFADVMVQDSEREMRGQLLDVSAGGLRFRGTGGHEIDTLLRVHVQLPSGPVVDAHGVVRMSQPGGVTAIEFTAFHVGSAQDIGAWTVGQLRKSLVAA